MADVKGRRCPRFEHACRTAEGAAVWDAVQRSGGWSGGGTTPRRIDRAAIRSRLDDVPGWIVEVLVDAFEPAALKAAQVAEKKKRTKNREDADD
ncbi:hypothetical protein [uncultured Brevundimonas sp.]|uniref:hypothetical protein n=1 Tax=uncultured Brevundimonas sp. TaxID=213418 RepID=UPI0025D1E76D|nr:hypothetical protein [uncultured Brevundimonas sp.]